MCFNTFKKNVRLNCIFLLIILYIIYCTFYFPLFGDIGILSWYFTLLNHFDPNVALTSGSTSSCTMKWRPSSWTTTVGTLAGRSSLNRSAARPTRLSRRHRDRASSRRTCLSACCLPNSWRRARYDKKLNVFYIAN